MASLYARLRSLWRALWRRDALNDDMEGEFRLHMELRARDLVHRGMSPAEAARQARLEFGSAESYKDRGRDARGLRVFDSLRFSLLDARLGARMLKKHPALTVIGTIAVAFAIAVGSVGFEAITQAMFPAIPLPNGNEIVALQDWNVGAAEPTAASRGDYVLWSRDLRTMTDIAAIVLRDRNVALGGGAGDPVAVADVTASMFAMTRVSALAGRTLLPADERPDAPPVVVIGYDFWQNKLGAAPDVLGRVSRVSGTATTIVGVMPRGYAFPRRDAVWRPLHIEQLPEAIPRISYVFGRMAPGHTIDEARAEFAAVGARTAAAFPETHARIRARIVTLPRALFPLDGDMTLALGSINIFLVIFVALICGNVALLLFARAASRRVEITVRSALGASRGRIVTQLFTEALVLCMVGLAAGLVTANILLQWLWTIVVAEEGTLPFWMSPSLSSTTILYAFGLTVFAAAIAGVVPALKVTSGGVEVRLRAMSGGGGGLQFGGVWTVIIVVQIAMTATLPLVTTFIREDMMNVLDVHAGFAADRFLTAVLALDPGDGAAAAGDTLPAARAARFERLYRTLADRLQNEPGVVGVTYGDRLPFMYHLSRAIEMDAGPIAPAVFHEGHYVAEASVDPRFFAVIGAAVSSGRSLAAADAGQSARAVVVNETFVKRVMGGLNPVGRQVRFASATGRRPTTAGEAPGPWYQIVGVVPDLGTSEIPTDWSAARFYRATRPGDARPFHLAVHVRGDPQRFAPRLRELAASVDPSLRLIDPMPLPRVLDVEFQFNAFWYHLLAGVAGVALLLSLAGVYAVTAFAVAKRTREIGVRVALGARPRQIILTVFKRPFIQIVLGIAVGAIIMTILVTGDHFTVHLAQLGEIGMAVAAMSFFCLLACIVPTRRALRIQPTEALKDDG
jgi:predicted permease